MRADEYESMADVFTDCAELPEQLRRRRRLDAALPAQRHAARWAVDDACLAQVRDLDEYV
ncbi:MAG: hypothetical protein J2O49_04210 [Sciscionella sp.]|nr:hypothetical protein [Sciscionella sp.]